MVSQLSKANKDILFLFFNRRHLIEYCEISIIVTTQSYHHLPYRIRECITNVIIFKISSKELKKICVDSSCVDYRSLNILMNKVEKTPYSFVMINVLTGQTFLKFDEVIMP